LPLDKEGLFGGKWMKVVKSGKRSMFLGTYPVSFSKDKNRLALPAKIRNELSGQAAVLTRGFEGCILGYDKREWEKSVNRELETPITEERGRDIRRYLFSAAAIVKFDRQGRIVIPTMLADYAQLAEKLVVVGAGDHFEIWEESLWKKHLNKINQAWK